MLTRKYYIDSEKKYAYREFSKILRNLINKNYKKEKYDIISIICIGTDRVIGDSLGPMVGYKLNNIAYPNVYVYGTLSSPVHAKNLNQYIDKLKNTFVIAVDASVGIDEHIGYVIIEEGGILPGAGVDKILPEVGDISITGIVNSSGESVFLELQNTRLNIVMKMADIISTGIKMAFWNLGRQL